MSMSIYSPYFYIIQHIQTGKYYAGVKFAKNTNPDNLLKSNGYQTSSEIVKQIILEEGLESFIVRKIKVFDTGEEALDYESKFLRKVNAAFNDNFLNRSNNSFGTLNLNWEKKKQTCLENNGVEYPLQSEEIREKMKQTCLKNHGVEYAMQSEEVREKYKQTCLDRFGVENSSQSEEVKEKYKKTNLERLGVEYPSQSPELQEKMMQTCLERYGVEYPLQSEEVKEKYKKTNLERLGVENPSQSPEVKERARQTRNVLCNRSIVSEIRKYKDRFKLKLGSSWFYKKKEFLDNMLLELKTTYGELEYL